LKDNIQDALVVLDIAACISINEHLKFVRDGAGGDGIGVSVSEMTASPANEASEGSGAEWEVIGQ
jgi:hypothetical protein